MRIAVLSDIHANNQALEAVLRDCAQRSVEQFWCLGDMVGYGPDPVTPLLWLQQHVDSDDWILGNHDALLADLIPAEKLAEFNQFALDAIALNRSALAQAGSADAFWQTEFHPGRIAPRRKALDSVNYVLTHSGQYDCLYRYVYAWQTELFLPDEFKLLWQSAAEHGWPAVQWYGHTHVPALIYACSEDGEHFDFDAKRIWPGESYALSAQLALINPGSVGQPRDEDHRAAYAILDTTARTVTFRRVKYEWRPVAQSLSRLGYPEPVFQRLWNPGSASGTPQTWKDHYLRAREVEL